MCARFRGAAQDDALDCVFRFPESRENQLNEFQVLGLRQ